MSAKQILFAALDLFGVNAIFRRHNRGKIKVLLYHNITPGRAHFANAISPEEFEEQIIYLKRQYNVIAVDADGTWQGLREDRVNILISFDDGFINNLEFALPVLKRQNVRALFFLIANCMQDGLAPHFVQDEGKDQHGSPYRTLTAKQARMLVDAGMTIGCHSLSHSDHRAMDDTQILTEGTTAKGMIAAATNREVGLFAFPWGYHVTGQEQKLSKLFARIFLTEHGFCESGDKVIPRNEVSDLRHMKVAASGALDWLRALCGKA